MGQTDFLNNALEKMKPKHVFISVIIVIVMVSIPPIITVSMSSSEEKALNESISIISEKQDAMLMSIKQTNWSIMAMLSGNSNNLTLSSSKEIIRAMLMSAKYRIILDVEGVLERNHISDVSRQPIIKGALEVRVNNYYNSDYSSMARLYYNNVQLSTIWDGIDKDELLDAIYETIFSGSGDKKTIHEDVVNVINNKFDGYYEHANTELNKMTIQPK
jgi:hypothetical protein